MSAWVYIMTNWKNGTLYIGVTSDLARRIFDHRNGVGSEFVRQHRLRRLVYVEAHATMPLAIAREKRLKTWNRAWKVRLINRDNPAWDDLFDLIIASTLQR
ncbi:GIY-YIG nuclease family protein [Dongia sp.]|uniref:GIY-YIG nuclease family protein n=1 Tax=Dongia sp. TaxID=1977262 RepID=UPI0037530EB7